MDFEINFTCQIICSSLWSWKKVGDGSDDGLCGVLWILEVIVAVTHTSKELTKHAWIIFLKYILLHIGILKQML